MMRGASSRSLRARRTGRCGTLAGLLSLMATAGVLSGCSQTQPPPPVAASSQIATAPLNTVPGSMPETLPGAPIPLHGDSGRPSNPQAAVQIGTGQFINPGIEQPQPIVVSGDDVSLNFVNADVRDVLRSVVGGLLKQAFVVDPAVQGTVTLETPTPIPRPSVISVLTTALQASGIGLVLRGDIYAAVPIADAARQAPINQSSAFVTRIVQLQYVSAAAVEQALQPLVPPGAALRADPARNVLLISGAAFDVATLADDVASFDVDYLRGMSFALLPLQNGQASAVAADVKKLLATASHSLGDMVTVAPIDGMNAVLVTAMQPAYLRQVEAWVARFDQSDSQTGQQIFVYRVQNGRATDLASVLRRALGIQGSDNATAGGSQAGVANAIGGGTQTGSDSGSSGGSFDITQTPDSTGASPAPATAGAAASAPASAPADVLLGGSASAIGAPPTSDVRVTADPTNNALIITATPQEYAPIRAALEQLDITPLQVLIEATVAEVSLTNQLSLGLQYYIKSGNFSAIFAPSLNANSPSTSTPFPGFGLGGAANVLYAAGGTNLVLQALQSLTTVHVLSSPDLLVLNNEVAKLQVGNQVPISTQSSTSTLTNTAQTVNAISYRDTGVILQVTPRVNASGLVQLDLTEEVSAPVASTVASSFDSINSPTISTRRVSSTLAINDGQTVVLAGLILQDDTRSRSGLPWLQNIPVLGYLFGTRSNNLTRTELIVLITPYVIRNQLDADSISNELRSNLRLAVPVAAAARAYE